MFKKSKFVTFACYVFSSIYFRIFWLGLHFKIKIKKETKKTPHCRIIFENKEKYFTFFLTLNIKNENLLGKYPIICSTTHVILATQCELVYHQGMAGIHIWGRGVGVDSGGYRNSDVGGGVTFGEHIYMFFGGQGGQGEKAPLPPSPQQE